MNKVHYTIYEGDSSKLPTGYIKEVDQLLLSYGISSGWGSDEPYDGVDRYFIYVERDKLEELKPKLTTIYNKYFK